MMNLSYKIGMVSLGCPKNQVDAEHMLFLLKNEGFILMPDAFEADIVIVNTCGFIEDAKKEAIENILDFAELKKEKRIRKIIVTGCLAERYREEVLMEIPEIDAVVGIGGVSEIARICREVIAGETLQIYKEKELLPLEGDRILTTPVYWAYLKIADGCDNCCSYCAIPGIRGRFRSRTMEDIVAEAKKLASLGTRELVLIAQDTTRYGEDIYGKLMLPDLLNELCNIEDIHWIRLLYCYPDRITDQLLDVIAAQAKVLPYIDLPLQHADAEILRKMNRTGGRTELSELLHTIRNRIPEAVIRTTLITGFPGEGEAEFAELAAFIKESKFERLGCFAYSPEEGTPAAEMENQIDEEIRLRRQEIVMEEQYGIAEAFNQQCIGRILEVLVEGYDEYIKHFVGRSYMDAPEIDGKVFFRADFMIHEGSFVNVKITDVMEYDLLGEAIQ